MIDYSLLVDRKKRAYKIIEDGYYIETHLFKNEINYIDYIEGLYSQYKDNKEAFNSDYEIDKDDNVFYSFIVVLKDIVATEKIKNMSKKEMIKCDLNFNGNDLSIEALKYRGNIYLIIDKMIPAAINKEDVICSVSIVENKFWYSFIDSVSENYIGVNAFKDSRLFVDQIRGLL